MLRNCSADTLFGRADDKLTRISSILRQLAKEQQEYWEEARLIGAPGECWNLIQRRYDSTLKVMFDIWGMDETEYLAAVRQRTSERWVYYNLPF